MRISDWSSDVCSSDLAEQPGLGFLDFLDVINPLQHLPIVGTIYRAMTGDTISDAARVAGGALYGGPFGLIGGFANGVFEAETGGDVGGNALPWAGGAPGTAGAAAPLLGARGRGAEARCGGNRSGRRSGIRGGPGV